MTNIPRTECAIARGLKRVEVDAAAKANVVVDSELRHALGLVAVSLALYRLRHENQCRCCARSMAVAA
jgi:hypothetical protein